MHVKKTRGYSLDDAVFIGALPDMGRVGGLVTQHLAGALGATECARIVSHDKPWVDQKGGIVSHPIDEYKMLISEENRIVILTGEGQPQEASAVIELANLALASAMEMGRIRMVISAGGYLPGDDASGDVFGVATNQRSLGMLKAAGVGVLDGKVSSITWFNGLVLGAAREKNIDGIGLFGRVKDNETPQYGAAGNIVRKISEMLDIKIDASGLDARVPDEEAAPPEAERTGPGIG